MYLQPRWHSWLQNFKKTKMGWLLQRPAMVVIGCWGLQSLTATCSFYLYLLGTYTLCVCIQYAHARNNCLHISVRLYWSIWMRSALLHDNSTSQCRVEVTRWWRALLVSQSGEFSWWVMISGVWEGRTGNADSGGVFQSLWAVCSLDAGQSLVWSWGLGEGVAVGGVIWWSEDSRSRLWPFAWPGPARPALWTPAESHWRGSALTPPWQQVAMV